MAQHRNEATSHQYETASRRYEATQQAYDMILQPYETTLRQLLMTSRRYDCGLATCEKAKQRFDGRKSRKWLGAGHSEDKTRAAEVLMPQPSSVYVSGGPGQCCWPAVCDLVCPVNSVTSSVASNILRMTSSMPRESTEIARLTDSS